MVSKLNSFALWKTMKGISEVQMVGTHLPNYSTKGLVDRIILYSVYNKIQW